MKSVINNSNCQQRSAAAERMAEIVADCESVFFDVHLEQVSAWKQEDVSRKAVGCLPIYTPREVMLASGVRPIGVRGGGDQVDIIRGDAYYQSYICHLPRSTVELGLSSWKQALDGLICPAICDVIRNLSGMWQMLFPDKLVYYLDLPHEFTEGVGGKFYRLQLEDLIDRLSELSGTKFSIDACRESIALYNENRRAINDLYELRMNKPHWVPTSELYVLVRAGDVLEVAHHTDLVREYTALAAEVAPPEQDNARIIVLGSFCEQPPLNLIKTIERAGCYIIDDDFNSGYRFLLGEVDENGDPLDALVNAYLTLCCCSSVKYEGDESRTEALVHRVKQQRADGVLLMSASFCDPSLLDRPHFQQALEQAEIPCTSLEYSENLGQFQTIREQTGTFSEAIKLWGEA